MVCICMPLGLHAENFHPKESGNDYALTPYLEIIKDYRGGLHSHLRVISRRGESRDSPIRLRRHS